MGYKKYPEGHQLATDKCWAKAFDDEMLFILMARDHTSPMVIMEWIKLNLHKQPPEKLREAFESALEMVRTTEQINHTLRRQKSAVHHDLEIPLGTKIEIKRPGEDWKVVTEKSDRKQVRLVSYEGNVSAPVSLTYPLHHIPQTGYRCEVIEWDPATGNTSHTPAEHFHG